MRLQNTKKHRTTLWEDFQGVFRVILDYGIYAYIIVLLAVFPFYNEAGYSHIGTDKAVFFQKFGVGAGKWLVLFLALYLIFGFGGLIAAAFREIRSGDSVADVLRKRLDGRKRISLAAAVDFFALIYCAVLIFSYAFTDYREEALWGLKRWYVGFIPQMMLVGIYFLVSRFWKPRKWLFYIIYFVSGAVFLMGCLNRFGIYAFGLKNDGPTFISTIGNINWYCGYAVSVMFAGTVLLWLGEGRVWQKAFLMLYTAIGYLSLLLQGSDSGLVALAVVMLVMFCMSAKDSGRMLVFWQGMTILSVECLGIFLVKSLAPGRINYIGKVTVILTGRAVSITMTLASALALLLVWSDRKRGKHRGRLFRILAWTAAVGSVCAVLGAVLMVVINTKNPGSLGKLSENPWFTFNDGWGSKRGATWCAGWKCFAAQDVLHKLVGVGPNCMWCYINSGKDQELYTYVTTMFPGLRLTNAHSEWLTILVDTGILGLIGYAGMMICGILELLKQGKDNPYAMACGFCLLAYSVNNIFSFQQPMAVGTVFVMFGIGKAFARRNAANAA